MDEFACRATLRGSEPAGAGQRLVWQAAARLDHIAAAGDYTVYGVGDRSVLLVRADCATVRAYRNVCPHRGTALGRGSGRFAGGQITCAFHGWRWDLHGKNPYVPEPFRNGRPDRGVGLREIQSVVSAGVVFIHMAADPQPSDESIAAIRKCIEGI